MLFVVTSRTNGGNDPGKFPWVALMQDNWDDYGYKTTYHATLHISASESVDLGTIKILKFDQKGGYTELPNSPFKTLTKSYCSFGGAATYYEALFKLGRHIYKPYLEGLRDICFDDEIRAHFEEQEGYKVSLMRFGGAARTIADAARLFQNKRITKQPSAGFVIKFKTRLAESASPITIGFDFRRRGTLPHRINALIGYNGTGKTSLLSNLAIVASGYGYSTKEDVLGGHAGRFVGSAPPFKRVIVLSYSAFDTFALPGRTEIERERLSREGRIFGYVYCGLRDRMDQPDEQLEEAYRLKTPNELEHEFAATLRHVREAERSDALVEFLRPLLQDASFQRIALTEVYAGTSEPRLIELFRGLSSGHKIVLMIVAQLAAHLDDSQPTLVLLDEPETHLHPPLLAALLKSVRVSLEHFNAYAIISTHSPVVLQETPSKYVQILRRIGDKSTSVKPNIETFGENIGIITQDVFNLDEGVTDWHASLREMAQTKSIEEIEEMFDSRLGFGPRSYVESVIDDGETE